MSVLLLAWVLAAPPVTFWVERDQQTLRLTTDLAPLFDARLRRLGSRRHRLTDIFRDGAR